MNDLFVNFEEFHRANPVVYEMFDKFTKLVLARGFTRYSADAIMHRIRWETRIETTGEDYKFSNDHVAYYSRLWLTKNPGHKGFFTLKQLRGGEPPMNAPVQPPVDIGTRIGQYVRLREKQRSLKERHKEELKPFTEALEQLELIMLTHLDQAGVDSVKGPAGTAYKITKKTASLADADAFRRHVIGTGEWDLADWKANSTACAAFVEENDVPPPGVSFNTMVEVGVRKPASNGNGK